MVAGRGLESFDVEPDLMIFTKGLGNGLPIAAVGGPADVMDSLGAGSISTFGGNHLVTTGALANVRYLLAEGTQANAAVQGERMRDVTERLAASHPHIIGEVRGKGLMQAIEFTDPDEKHTPRPDVAGDVQEACRRRGLLVGKGGIYWNVLRISPPLVVTQDEIDEAMGILIEAVAEVVGV